MSFPAGDELSAVAGGDGSSIKWLTFEPLYRMPKNVFRRLKRYHLADALFASLEEPEVMAAVIKRLR
ncbi:hypothetical protein ACINK0_15765 [Deinococcus sp. VB343]|uniref:Uncharacterized protein n=1 Tax=Deinococcus sp. VB142 TaxID=3112952 RepID=A0AAU6Q8D8_9DEIO